MIRADVVRICPGVSAIRPRTSVVRRGIEARLSPTQFQMVLLIARARPYGIPLEQLFDAIYAGTADPPITGRKALAVQRVIANQKLRPLEIILSSAGAGRRGGVYELQVLPSRVVEFRSSVEQKRGAP